MNRVDCSEFSRGTEQSETIEKQNQAWNMIGPGIRFCGIPDVLFIWSRPNYLCEIATDKVVLFGMNRSFC